MPPSLRFIKLRVSLDLYIRRSVKFAETEGDEDNSSGKSLALQGKTEKERGREEEMLE